jgi:hypothetical protein
MIRLRRLALLCFILPVAAHAERPVENYISPPQLFPEEGTARAPYVPLPAYDRPDGKLIGQITAKLTPCAPLKPPEECDQPPSWNLELRDGRRIELHHEMVGYDQEALVSYEPARIAAGKAWTHIAYDGGAFWTVTDAKDVSNHEAIATWIQDFDTWCSQPGKCAPVTPAMRTEIDLMRNGGYALTALGNETYRIDGVAHHGGRRYYKVSIVESEPGKPQPQLPKTGYIPTRGKDGAHVGLFYPKGC